VIAPTVAGAALGALFAAQVPAAILRYVLLGTMVTMAAVMVMRPRAALAPEGSEPIYESRRALGAVSLFVVGLYGGFVQAGVGILLLGVLSGVLRYDLLRANALKLACVAVFGVVALGIFIAAGQVVWLPGCLLAVYTVIGTYVGVRFAMRVSQDVIRWIVFVCVVATCAAALIRG